MISWARHVLPKLAYRTLWMRERKCRSLWTWTVVRVVGRVGREPQNKGKVQEGRLIKLGRDRGGGGLGGFYAKYRHDAHRRHALWLGRGVPPLPPQAAPQERRRDPAARPGRRSSLSAGDPVAFPSLSPRATIPLRNEYIPTKSVVAMGSSASRAGAVFAVPEQKRVERATCLAPMSQAAARPFRRLWETLRKRSSKESASV